MMICRADFEELFPEMFEKEDRAVDREPKDASDASISRWKDDGGRVIEAPEPSDISGRRTDKTRATPATHLHARRGYAEMSPYAK